MSGAAVHTGGWKGWTSFHLHMHACTMYVRAYGQHWHFFDALVWSSMISVILEYACHHVQ